MTFLEVSQLSKTYGGVQALQNVSFKMAAGESVGIQGDNGAGKSTLLQCLSGAICPDHGHIMLDGRAIPVGNPGAIRRMGIETVYQDLALCRGQSVVENLFLGREQVTRWGFLDHAQMRTQAQTHLATINADIPLDTALGQLSGGQQQAVAVARALLGNPRLVIFDEPTAALGARERAHVLSLVRHLTERGIATLIVSHRPDDLAATTSRILTMAHGRIV